MMIRFRTSSMVSMVLTMAAGRLFRGLDRARPVRTGLVAVTMTWDELRELAGFRAEKGCAISVYVDLDPREVPTPPDVETKVNSVLAAAERQLDERKSQLARDQREGLKHDLE